MIWTRQYHELLEKCLFQGEVRDDPNRVGVTRTQVPFHNVCVDTRLGFPILTTKKMWWKGIVVETLWMLRGHSNLDYLHQNNVHIWDMDAKDGDIGRMYGVQWRGYRSGDRVIDQLEQVTSQIRECPLSSNHTIFGDNPLDRSEQSLPCCMNHMQFLCDGEHLDLSINYRSWDVLLGAPWNVAQYALILHLMAHTTHTTPRYLNVNAHNVHLYSNQLEAAHEQLMRDPYEYDPPRLELQTTPPVFNWGGIDKNSCKLINYKSYGKLEKQPPMLSYT